LGSSAELRRYIDANVVTIIFCNQSCGRRALFNVIRDKLEALAFGGKVNIPPKTTGKPFKDLKPFADILVNKEKRAQRIREFIQMRIKRYQKQTGKIIAVLAVHTLPGQHEGEMIPITTVRLNGEKESIYFDLYWKEGKNVGVSPRMRPENLALPILPLESNKNEFAGYHLPMAKTIRLSFKTGKDEGVEGLTVHNHQPKQEFFAKKIVH
jgi:hypothetical protein